MSRWDEELEMVFVAVLMLDRKMDVWRIIYLNAALSGPCLSKPNKATAGKVSITVHSLPAECLRAGLLSDPETPV